ncbi:mediator of RNA polymerase II transcription subunit 28-like [Tropilaelaps mercedesae]|uniref:Mediator of RNA polymerase II transcription subunit 28 n=1 Tax=Tropilaelaps mercedesae TaxID=418985 RepID=A0A1V9XYQ1_9ACAR|nr:mediator of RNA polymerase II transcription subunit 28-like [Tropilaelaps mercedesae]
MSNTLVDELEAAFQACLAAAKNPDHFGPRDNHDERKAGVEQTVQKFLDTARQMECFFLQKRLVVSPQKAVQFIMEDNMELKNELARKEQLIEKYHTKLSDWQRLVNDASICGLGSGGGGGPSGQRGGAQGQPPQGPPMGVQGGAQMMGGGGQIMGVPQLGGMPPQQMVGSGGMISSANQQLGGGPLAYLERTTSNIGTPPSAGGHPMGGMPQGPPDGRR